MQRRRILPPPGRSGIPGLVGGRYCPVKTAALSELPYTPDICLRLEESIRDMPLLWNGCGIDKKMAYDGHNEVDARYRWCSQLVTLSTWRRCIIDPGRFLTGGPPAAIREDRGAVLLQHQSPPTASFPLQRSSTETGFKGGYMATLWSLSKVVRK